MKFFNFKMVSCFVVALYINFAYCTCITPNELHDKSAHVNLVPKILIVWSSAKSGGVPKLLVTLYKKLVDSGIDISIFVDENSYIRSELDEQKLPYFCARFESKKNKEKSALKNALVETLTTLCEKYDIKIIHANRPIEVSAALKVAENFKITVIAQEHSYHLSQECFRGVHAFTATSPRVAMAMKKANDQYALGIKVCDFLPPLTEEELFVDFVPQFKSKDEYFRKTFGIAISNAPTICMIANFSLCKNHGCLIRAVSELIHVHKIPVHVILAGEGSLHVKQRCRTLASVLRIDQYVHFVGFVHDIPSLLYYSNIKVLPSKGEAFSIAIMEAAFMQKTIVLSHHAGSAESIIKHKKTGLLFNPYDYQELAACLKSLIENKNYACSLGKNVCDLVKKEYTSRAIVRRYVDFYKKAYELSKK
ncbi:MAG: glycosyltransferase family 4 protein [Candidatus Babeliales bacterium]